MGIGDVINNIFGKQKPAETKNEKPPSKPEHKGHTDQHGTEDINNIKTENITGAVQDSEDAEEGETDKPVMNENTNDQKNEGLTEAKILEVLSNVYDPEIPVDIVNLGLIYGVKIDGDRVDLQMTMTSPGCPASVQITAESKYLIEELDGVSEANIEIVWDPPWSPEKMSEEAKQSLGFI